jgi:hypothetical protein
MTSRPRATAKALVALAVAAATPDRWVAVPTVVYILRLAVTEARIRNFARHDQEHPHA